jgi:hypothetical protein
MYEKDEILIITEDVKNIDQEIVIPKKAKVKFVKVSDSADLGQSLIAVEYDGRVLVTLESNVKFKSWFKRRRAFKAFNKQMMANNPRLRRYHPNIFIRVYYKIYYFIKDRNEK